MKAARFSIFISIPDHDCFEEALLEFSQRYHLFVGVLHPVRDKHQFIITIVQAVDSGDSAPFELFEGLEYAWHMSVLLFAVWGLHPRDIAVI